MEFLLYNFVESVSVIHRVSMKTLKLLFVLVLIVGIGTTTKAQTTRSTKKAAKQAAIKKSIEGRNFTFDANQATPLAGAPKTLTGTYDLHIKADSIISFLPYFGRAYFDVGYNETNMGIKFTSTKFDYQAVEKKNGSWIITIKPGDVKNIESLILLISVDGYASLTVTSTNRDVISYDGYLK